MEINLALIKAIQKHQKLYDKTGSLEETKRIWKQLEAEFQTEDKWLKARWDWLVQSFCDKPGFKYGNDMSYLLPHLGIVGIKTRREWPHSIVPKSDGFSDDEVKVDKKHSNMRFTKKELFPDSKTDDDLDDFMIFDECRTIYAEMFENKPLELMDTVDGSDKQEIVEANGEVLVSEEDRRTLPFTESEI
ncbi:uncharacterized protein LOC119662210 [Teleopsis dalmanni]|uniref:uncharacterized protein LOC119662210 n=1 Tax=Teleopsis dalmanni TaxID=139649 RepID=UPI0018CCECC4|nr:uncharacterized protein LOC119662210 [Teleopsis dalmanni]